MGAQSKYRAVRTARVLPNGETRMFDSKREAERYDQLSLMQKAGQIRNLKLQPEFTLQDGFVDAQTGERVKPIVYKADFAYEANAGGATRWQRNIEDVKGVRTKEYLLKAQDDVGARTPHRGSVTEGGFADESHENREEKPRNAAGLPGVRPPEKRRTARAVPLRERRGRPLAQRVRDYAPRRNPCA